MTHTRIRIGERELEYDGDNAAEFAALCQAFFGLTPVPGAPELETENLPAASPAAEVLCAAGSTAPAIRISTSKTALTTVVMSVSNKQGEYAAVTVRIPEAMASRVGLEAHGRADLLFSNDRKLVVTPTDRGGVSVVRQSASTVQVQFGGGKHGLRESHPSTPSRSSSVALSHLVIDLPSWWPDPEHVSRRARETAPVRVLPPQVRSKSNNTPPQRPDRGHVGESLQNGTHIMSAKRQRGEAVDGGELIPVADREFFCHTCEVQVATITCDDCNGLFCAGCWSSHLLTHKRAAAAARREEVARA